MRNCWIKNHNKLTKVTQWCVECLDVTGGKGGSKKFVSKKLVRNG